MNRKVHHGNDAAPQLIYSDRGSTARLTLECSCVMSLDGYKTRSVVGQAIQLLSEGFIEMAKRNK